MGPEAAQKTPEWVPLAQSAIVGIFTVTGVFLAQWWTMRRDLRNKAAEALEKREQRRSERQFDALINLQDAAQEFSFAVLDSLTSNQQTIKDDPNVFIISHSEEVLKYRTKLVRMMSRVDDEKVRETIQQLIDVRHTDKCYNRQEINGHAADLSSLTSHCYELIGVMLRKLR